MPTDNQRAKHIFEQWKAELTNKDRGINAVPDNFDELFWSMYASGINQDLAHSYLKDAIAAHMPNHHCAKNTYRRSNIKSRLNMDFKEWTDDWKDKIKDLGTVSFYQYYPAVQEEVLESADRPERKEPEPRADANDAHLRHLKELGKRATKKGE